MPTPSIVIDGIEFTLIRKRIEKTRLFVNIMSRNEREISDFWVYPSFSELGLWRLCMFDTPEILFKGHDYVQTTFIHFTLQAFINLHLDSLQLVELSDEEIKSQCVCSSLNNITDEDTIIRCPNIQEANKYISYDIESGERIINIPQFRKFNLCGTRITSEEIRSISKTVEKYYICANNITPVQQHNTIFEESSSDGRVIKLNVTGNIFRVSLISKPITKEEEDELNEKINEKMEMQENTKDIDIYYELESEIKEIEENLIQPPNLELYFFAGALENISNPDEIESIYADLHLVCGIPLHIFPCLLTTRDSVINKFGLYSKYVFSGAFICKLFDYHQQCREDEDGIVKCTPSYSYIGTRYTKMFPYDQLIRKIKEQAICHAKMNSNTPSPEFGYSPIRSRSSTSKESKPRRSTAKTSSPSRRSTAKKKSSRRSRTPELKVKKRRSISR